MQNNGLKYILEALLMSSSKPLSIEQLAVVFEENPAPDRESIEQALTELALDYEPRAIELQQVATGYCIQTKSRYSGWISRLHEEKPIKYSRALLETLAIIAYRQPVTRADIEAIRGVAVHSPILRTLLERDWIKVAGHRDVPGKPAVYVTTKAFLDYFNLTSLHQLPPLPLSSSLPVELSKPEECIANE